MIFDQVIKEDDQIFINISENSIQQKDIIFAQQENTIQQSQQQEEQIIAETNRKKRKRKKSNEKEVSNSANNTSIATNQSISSILKYNNPFENPSETHTSNAVSNIDTPMIAIQKVSDLEESNTLSLLIPNMLLRHKQTRTLFFVVKEEETQESIWVQESNSTTTSLVKKQEMEYVRPEFCLEESVVCYKGKYSGVVGILKGIDPQYQVWIVETNSKKQIAFKPSLLVKMNS